MRRCFNFHNFDLIRLETKHYNSTFTLLTSLSSSTSHALAQVDIFNVTGAIVNTSNTGSSIAVVTSRALYTGDAVGVVCDIGSTSGSIEVKGKKSVPNMDVHILVLLRKPRVPHLPRLCFSPYKLPFSPILQSPSSLCFSFCNTSLVNILEARWQKMIPKGQTSSPIGLVTLTWRDCSDYLDEPVKVEYGNNFEEVTDEKRLSYIEAQLEQLEGTHDSASSVFEVPLLQRLFHSYDVELQASSSSAFIGPRQPAPLKTKKMEGLTCSQRQKWNYTMKQREKRQEAAQTRDIDCSLKSNALCRAKDAEHVEVGELDVGDLPASEPGFIGLRELSEDQFQAISAFKVIRWKGNNAGYTQADYKHRRADEDEGYAACGSGISLGGGQERPGNIAIRRKRTRLAMEELRKDPNIMRVVGHTGTLYKAFGHKLATESRDNIRALKKQFPDLIPFEYPSPDGPYWAAAMVNSAPVASDAQVVTV
ncbi:hypothetical protein VNI00_018951 [Paramarasmius palmivorus]|uniref:Uncharacterized protein n=1 Tax=Paramarasmius palmivorus TaxID=297713 RepID=A0AAW0AT39_9AGAR